MIECKVSDTKWAGYLERGDATPAVKLLLTHKSMHTPEIYWSVRDEIRRQVLPPAWMLIIDVDLEQRAFVSASHYEFVRQDHERGGEYAHRAKVA